MGQDARRNAFRQVCYSPYLIGQTTMIVPSHDLVVVRLGHYKGEAFGAPAFRKVRACGRVAWVSHSLLMEAEPRRSASWSSQ